MSNKARGSEIEDLVIKKLGLQKADSNEYDALDNGTPIEIKSSELVHKDQLEVGFIKTRLGRFSIAPAAHNKLKPDSEYIFVVLLEEHPLFLVKLPWSVVNERIKRYDNPTMKYKLLISEVVDKAKKIPDSLVFL